MVAAVWENDTHSNRTYIVWVTPPENAVNLYDVLVIDMKPSGTDGQFIGPGTMINILSGQGYEVHRLMPVPFGKQMEDA